MDGWTNAKEDMKKKLERRYLPFQLSDCFIRTPHPKLYIHAFGLLFVPGQRCSAIHASAFSSSPNISATSKSVTPLR